MENTVLNYDKIKTFSKWKYPLIVCFMVMSAVVLAIKLCLHGYRKKKTDMGKWKTASIANNHFTGREG